MFQKNRTIQEAIDDLVRSFGQKERGELVTWEEIEGVLGMYHLERPAPYIIKQFREWVRKNKNIILDCERGVGLRFLEESDRVTGWTLKGQKRALRQTKRTKRDNHHADDTLLDTHHRRIKMMNDGNLRAAQRAQGRVVAQLRKRIGTPTLPQRQPEVV